MGCIIRKKQRKDCFTVAHVVTIAWNETYKGIVSDDFLNNLYLDEEERATNSYNNFNEKSNHQYVLEIDGKIVGFISVGPSAETNYYNFGEIYSIYIINEYKGYGFGKKLIEAGINELKKMGYDKMMISCLVGNPSNKFYEHIGGKYIKQRIFEKLQLPENVYYYEKI